MIDQPAFQAGEVGLFSVVGPTASKGSTPENDCNSPLVPATVIHSHGPTWQWRKQARATPGSEWATEQDDDIKLAHCRTAGHVVECPSLPFGGPWAIGQEAFLTAHQTLTVSGEFSKLDLSSAAHSSDSNPASCDFALCYSRARSPKIWPRQEEHYAFARVVDRTLFSAPFPF